MSAKSYKDLGLCLSLTMWGFFKSFSLGAAKSNGNIDPHSEQAQRAIGHKEGKLIIAI